MLVFVTGKEVFLNSCSHESGSVTSYGHALFYLTYLFFLVSWCESNKLLQGNAFLFIYSQNALACKIPVLTVMFTYIVLTLSMQKIRDLQYENGTFIFY